MTEVGDSPRLDPADLDGSGSAFDSEPFWINLRAHRIVVQECPHCRHCWLPRMPACPYCNHAVPRSKMLSGTGTVYSWVRVHRTRNPQFLESLPYVIGTVEIAPRCRTFARLEGVDPPEIGGLVTPLFIDHDGWTELRFQTAAPTPSRER